jgi:hypothetical protein
MAKKKSESKPKKTTKPKKTKKVEEPVVVEVQEATEETAEEIVAGLVYSDVAPEDRETWVDGSVQYFWVKRVTKVVAGVEHYAESLEAVHSDTHWKNAVAWAGPIAKPVA